MSRDNVIPFPGLESFAREPWRFLIDDPDGARERPQTFAKDSRVVVVTAESGDNTKYFASEIWRTDSDQWRWEVESRTGEIESDIVDTLAAAVAAAEASVIRRFRGNGNHYIAA